MITYIHQLPEWPVFHWDTEQIAPLLAGIRYRQGRLLGQMESLGFSLQNEAMLRMQTQDVVKSSEIEGETLDAGQVRSSIARRLGIDIGGLQPTDRRVEGVVEMMLDATTRFERPLSSQRLFAWQAALFPTGRSGLVQIRVGAWRDDARGAMQVVSGPFGREYVHFEAPTAEQIEHEMQAFLDWFNAAEPPIDPVLKAGIAHLWFVTVHPFEDGNGRIARAIADLALARSEGTSRRFYSMSAQIQRERARYYDVLEQTQQQSLDITRWLTWFLECLGSAIERAEQELDAIFVKARFWDQLAGTPISERQRQMLNRLLDGFDGKLTSSKWAKLTKTSQDTAYRDITDLLAKGILVQDPAGGRSTSYSLAPVPSP
jgi:Fic family protein